MKLISGLLQIALFIITWSVTADESSLFLQSITDTTATSKQLQRSEELLKDYKETEVLGDLALVPFHKRNAKQISNTEEVFCNTCHMPLPHNHSLRNRAFMNMHSQYIACETCHFKPENTTFRYRWFNYKQRKEAENTRGRLHSGRDTADKTLLLPRDGDVKIAPFYQGKPALITTRHTFAEKIKQQWQDADKAAKVKLHAQIHQSLTVKGTECADCHTRDEDMLDLLTLSDSDEQAKKIQRNTIADFFKHYKPEKPLAPGELPPPEQRIKITDLLN